MRRASLLETQVRRQTGNTRTGTADAVSSEEFLQYLTDGQTLIQRRGLLKNRQAFREETTWSADGAERKALPADVFLNSVISVQYSSSGNAQDYVPLTRVTELERFTTTGSPDSYILDGSDIIINPYPSTGTFRLIYNKEYPRLDKRRATVASKTTSSTALTALTLTGYTAADYDLFDHLTIVDFNGTVKMRGIPYTSVHSGTGVVTIYNSSYTFPSGSTIAVGDYVCLGENSSTHSQLPNAAEDFLLMYCAKRIQNRDGSSDSVDTDPEVIRMADEIVDVMSDDSADVNQVPVINEDYALDI